MPEQDNLVIDNKPTVTTDPFDGSPAPVVHAPVIIEKKDEPVITDTKDEPIIEKKDEPVIIEDGRNYLKDKLGYEDWDAAKAEIETLRTKSQLPVQQKYDTVDVAKIKEIYATIDKKERLQQLVTGDITPQNAVAIVKAAMQEKYKGLTQSQIDYKFNKQFSVSKEPVQGDEADEDFQMRQNEWKEQVANTEMELLIEANLARPELEKINNELKLPDIIQTEDDAPKEPTPEELAKIQSGRNAFVQDAEAELKKFEGFKATYKDKDVEVQTGYKLSDEENKTVLNHIKEFADSNYNANVIFGKRWVKGDKFDFAQMAKDLATLDTEDNRSQKYIGDTAAKAKLFYLKQKHNIDLDNGSGGGELRLEDKELQKKKEDAIWN